MGINQVFKALNDPTRRKLLEVLWESDLTAGDIAEQFDMSKPSISHHLDQLKQADLVLSVKKGQFVFYSLHTTVLDDLMSWIVGLQGSDTSIQPSES